MTKRKIFKKDIVGFLSKKPSYNIKPNLLKKVSFLLVTYNRCPSEDHNKNPLFWAIMSLLKSKLVRPNEIIVIDDNSDDFTAQTISKIKQMTKIDLIYVKNTKRMGCSYSRNIGLKKANYGVVIMGDDDCLYKPNFLFIALFTYYFLEKKYGEDRVAIINFPVYEKSTFPKNSCRSTHVGKVDLDNTVFYHNFDCFFEEYLERPIHIKHSNILAPIGVDTFSGINLSNKKIIQHVGGYSDLSQWDNDYSEHIELSYKIQSNNFKIFHQSDPRSGSIHLKYGRKSQDKFDKRQYVRSFLGIKYSLGDIVSMSEEIKVNSGCGCDVHTFHVNEIGTLFSFYLKISKKLAIKFAEKEFRNYVIKNLTFSTTPEKKIETRHSRYQIWQEAINRAVNITSVQTGHECPGIITTLLDWSNKQLNI